MTSSAAHAHFCALLVCCISIESLFPDENWLPWRGNGWHKKWDHEEGRDEKANSFRSKRVVVLDTQKHRSPITLIG